MAKDKDYAEYLTAEYLDNRYFEDMTEREFVEMELATCDVASYEQMNEYYATREEAIADLTEHISAAYASYKQENNI